MKVNYNGDWKSLLFIGGILLAIFLVLGLFVSAIFGLFVWVVRGLGFLIGTLVKFTFQSIFSFAAVAILAYLGYRYYVYLKEPDKESDPPIDYSDDDFER